MEREKIIAFLQANIPNVRAGYVFGSRADGTVHGESDWDIAFLPDSAPMDTLERWKLAQALAAELNADVDLIDLQAASTVLRFQIITTGERLFCTDHFFCENFEIMVYSSYQYLQEERKEILEAIKKRGSVYG